MKVEGLGAIVTGGASGLGAATATALAQAGAKVTIFDLDEQAGLRHAERIGGRYARVDVTDDEAVAAAVAEAETVHGVARVLVTCAGIAPAERTVGRGGVPHSATVFRKVIGVNLIGTFNAISQFAARLSFADPIGEERGVIVATASVAAFDGQIGQAAYAASKAAVAGMTLPVARDLATLGIRVMTIAPGIFLTPMLEGLPQATQDSLGRQVPFPSRLGKPAEYADLVTAIVGNPMLNGETIRLDGAIRMAPK